MIIDTLSNAERYFCIHPLFSEAFDHIKSLNLQTIESGNYEIDGERLHSLVFNKQGMTVAESIAKFECHNKHIDIQLCINGSEQIGWRSRNTCSEPNGEFNSEKDFIFYKDKPDMYLQLKDNQFVILFPEDVHAPMIGKGIIKKLVIKVLI